ncbi:hypothetical protein GP486_003556 [Trichoglossum hirsutum]|uniref:peptidylprolyl isomerase n=1 Tax=Trichoglossum hirsutum TaxID=265104 RepID=A0A9P8LCN6_9PEZI|nr:hypothetical protein GP486_003556 [Trichoglossum hirsutum]
MPAQARTSNAARHRTDLPAYQPQEQPTTAAQARQIESLSQSHSFAKLKRHLQDASDAVSTVAGEINDRSMIMQETHKRRRARRIQQGLEDDENEDEQSQRVEEYTETAERMTDEMEAVTRDIIDSSERVKAAEGALKDLARNIAIGPAASQAGSSGHRRRRRRRGSSGSESDEPEHGASPDRVPAENHPGPLEMLKGRLSQHKAQYESQSLHARYANHNNYIGFKRVVHDSRHPDNAPPLPNSTTWFPSDGRNSRSAVGRARRGVPAENADDDIEIEGEHISLKCPLTLLPFEDPVTSKKCPHSFERSAILPMIQNSEARVGGVRRGEGERAVKCPICEEMLTINDLYSDKVLLRRIKRQQRGGSAGSGDESEEGLGHTQPEEISEDFGENIDEFEDEKRVLAASRSTTTPRIKQREG